MYYSLRLYAYLQLQINTQITDTNEVISTDFACTKNPPENSKQQILPYFRELGYWIYVHMTNFPIVCNMYCNQSCKNQDWFTCLRRVDFAEVGDETNLTHYTTGSQAVFTELFSRQGQGIGDMTQRK